MKKEVILCDRCGSEGAKTASIFICRQMDAAGSMDNEYEYVDLCHKCALITVGWLTKNLSRAENAEALREMRKKVQP